MKYLLLATTLLALPLVARAQPVDGLYIGGGAGVNFLQNEIFKPYGGFGPIRRTYTFDPGPAVVGNIGYGFGNGLRLELQGDYLNNHVRKAELSEPERAGGHEQQFGGFVNALYDFDAGLPVYPYLGVGVGYQAIDLAGVNSSSAASHISGGGSETSGNFAYQAIAGASYPIALVPGLSLTAEYRFVGVLTPPAFDRGNGSGDTYNGEPPRATVNNIFNHEILVGVRYGFGAPLAPPLLVPLPVTTPTVAPARTYLVFFDWDRADLTDRARQIVAEAAQASTRVQTTRIEVQGNADRSGTPAYNQGLSLRRAQTVAAELVRQGVPKTAIDIQAFGDTRPLVPTAAGVREPQNRRVAIILH
jgi:OmpA-OmpF porin, OOP family